VTAAPEQDSTTADASTTGTTSAPEQDGRERSRRALIQRNKETPARLEHGLRRRDSEALRVVCHEKTCISDFSICETRSPGSACEVAETIRRDCESFVNALPETCSWIKRDRDILTLSRLSEMLFRKQITSILLNGSNGGLTSALCSKATTAARLLQHLSQSERSIDKLTQALRLNPHTADLVKPKIKVRGRWVDVPDEDSMQMVFMRRAAAARAEAAAMDDTAPAPVEIDAHECETGETW